VWCLSSAGHAMHTRHDLYTRHSNDGEGSDLHYLLIYIINHPTAACCGGRALLGRLCVDDGLDPQRHPPKPTRTATIRPDTRATNTKSRTPSPRRTRPAEVRRPTGRRSGRGSCGTGAAAATPGAPAPPAAAAPRMVWWKPVHGGHRQVHT
jgi:hypothetical protein